MMVHLLLQAAVATLPRQELGKADAACRQGEAGPALMVEVVGLRDRRGLLKLEAYPPDDAGFLADDATLVAEGRVFRRIEVPPPRTAGSACASACRVRDGTRSAFCTTGTPTTASTCLPTGWAFPETRGWAGPSPSRPRSP